MRSYRHKGDREEEGSSILQPPLPQIRHFDCEFLFLILSGLFKALIYCNGELVQEMYDHSVVKLRQRLRKRLIELAATSHSPLTKAVQWATEQSALDSPDTVIQIQDSEGKTIVFNTTKQNYSPKIFV